MILRRENAEHNPRSKEIIVLPPSGTETIDHSKTGSLSPKLDVAQPTFAVLNGGSGNYNKVFPPAILNQVLISTVVEGSLHPFGYASGSWKI